MYVYPGISCQKTPTVYGYPVVPPKKTFSRKQSTAPCFVKREAFSWSTSVRSGAALCGAGDAELLLARVVASVLAKMV